jgi:hypothetical protein
MTKDEERFIEYWKQNRDREKKPYRALIVGLPLGLLIGIGVVVSLASGWYERASMEAKSELNPFVFIIAIVAIIVFICIFYQRYRWDMNEQHYKELLYKKSKEQKNEAADSSSNPS